VPTSQISLTNFSVSACQLFSISPDCPPISAFYFQRFCFSPMVRGSVVPSPHFYFEFFIIFPPRRTTEDGCWTNALTALAAARDKARWKFATRCELRIGELAILAIRQELYEDNSGKSTMSKVSGPPGKPGGHP
jgi:hypothetical protein